MQVYTRYKLAARRWGLRSIVYAVLGCAGLGFLAWVFWRTAADLEPPAKRAAKGALPPAPTPARQTPPSTSWLPAPVLPTNAPTSAPRIVVSTNLVVRTNLPPPPGRPASSNTYEATPGGPSLQPPGDVLELQLALGRVGISPGSLDGVLGLQTRAALRTFQRRERLPVTGQLDAATRARLGFVPPPLTLSLVTGADLAALRPLSSTWLGKSLQDRLGYETVLELVAERAQAHPALIRQLNPQVDWLGAVAGLTVWTPNPQPPAVAGTAERVWISLGMRTLAAYGARGQLLVHFPCSIARLVEKRPVGVLRVVVIIPNPSYTFNPAVFPESAEGRKLGRKLLLPPGPNNPVGTTWIGLDRAGYGIHGTPRPEDVGRTESHGCFRLANWNAELLARLVSVGTPVDVGP